MVWLTLNTQPMFDDAGDVDGVILTFTDTTAEREAQAALRTSEARFAALVERSSDIICVLDADGGVQYASPAADRLLGPAGMAIGRSFLDLVHPDDIAAARKSFDDIAAVPGRGRHGRAPHPRPARATGTTWRRWGATASTTRPSPAWS